jgi:hypothetical protein
MEKDSEDRRVRALDLNPWNPPAVRSSSANYSTDMSVVALVNGAVILLCADRWQDQAALCGVYAETGDIIQLVTSPFVLTVL